MNKGVRVGGGEGGEGLENWTVFLEYNPNCMFLSCHVRVSEGIYTL